MNHQTLLAGVVGLVLGGLLVTTVAAGAVNSNNTAMMRMMGMSANGHGTDMDETGHGGSSMADMTASLKGKNGDDFDKTFMQEMIVHHEGALEMAKLAQKQAKHDEIKSLAQDIMASQSKEIDLMQTWQGEWGYKVVPSMMSH